MGLGRALNFLSALGTFQPSNTALNGNIYFIEADIASLCVLRPVKVELTSVDGGEFRLRGGRVHA